MVDFTNNGTRRADSEARRLWSYVCQVEGCGQRFNRPCRLEAHIRNSHYKERPFACPHDGCSKTFPRKDHLQRHLRTAHVEQEYTCDWEGCNKTFTTSGRLKRHMDVHASKFYCTGYPPCKEVFRKQKTLDAHIKTEHLQAKPYTCPFVEPATGERCGYGYETEGALRRHLARAHRTTEEERHFCMLCVPSGGDANEIQKQVGETLSIPQEPVSFATREELWAHSREAHPPVCPECNVEFSSRQNLKAHRRTAHGNPDDLPRFPCPNPGCNAVFNRKSNLGAHIQSVHEKQIKFFCTADATNQSKHPDLKGWDGENACGDGFKSKSAMEQHIRTHHLGFQNRRATRKLAKAKSKSSQPSTIGLLTGVGYEEERNFPCLAEGCEFRFFGDRDVRRHLAAVHHLSGDEIATMLLMRDAMTGGQFWIGGLEDNEPTSMFSSTEPSVPQTPMPFFTEPPSLVMPDVNQKSIQEPFAPFDPSLDNASMFDAEAAEMDAAMGLGDLPPAVDVHEELWDMLVPVQQLVEG